MNKRLREEFKPVTLVTIIEHKEKVWPDVVDKGCHEKPTLEDQVLAPDDAVRRHEHEDGVLGARVRTQRLGHVESLAEVRAPLYDRLRKNSLVGLPWQGLFFQVSSEAAN